LRSDENGQRNLLEITPGNIPGRQEQEAGKIWGEEYTRFLTKDCGITQSQVDRRLFYQPVYEVMIFRTNQNQQLTMSTQMI
jgi:hypothetical protein